MTSPRKTPADLTEPFVLEGALSEVHTEVGRQNLLSKVLRHYKGQSAVTGIAAAAGDLFGMAANSAMLAMYDGEDTENFVALIDGQPICGTFGGASKLPEGGKIKAVVSRHGEVLIAHALMSDELGFLWITHPCGSRAELVANFRLGGGVAIATTVILSVIDLIVGPVMSSHLEFTLMMAVAGAALCLVMALWANNDMKALAGPATEIFRMLGFEKPERVNLHAYKYGIVYYRDLFRSTEKQHQHENIHLYKKAIEDGKIKMAV